MKKYIEFCALIVIFFFLTKCEKEATLPILSTLPVTNIKDTSAISGGIIISDGGSSIISNGVCWSTSIDPSVDDSKTIDNIGTTQFVSNINGLIGGTIYHIRSYAINSVGTAYGNDITFTTLGQLPSSYSFDATNITTNSATINGAVNPNYLSTVVIFEYGLTTNYGNIITPIQNTNTGNSNINITADITGLIPGTIYHYRIRAENNLGISYGNNIVFETTLTGIKGTINDNDGNIYQTIGIGYQVWMAENLRTTKYNDGTDIPNVFLNLDWISLKSGAYCDFNNDTIYSNSYGKLYNWYVVDNNYTTKEVSNDGKNVCPDGWHIPNDMEWTILENYLIVNGYNWDGTTTGNKIAKSMASTSGWYIDSHPGIVGFDQESNNRSGFTALPSAYRLSGDGSFSGAFGVYMGIWWASTENSLTHAYTRIIDNGYNYYHDNSGLDRQNYSKQGGLSVRCLKDK
jgi:uncharacterized protein (TIGR02145 family)